MNTKPKINRSDSKKTLRSQWMENEALNESLDLDSEDFSDKKGTKVHLLKSIFDDRPPTVFFQCPKCCGRDNPESDRVYCL